MAKSLLLTYILWLFGGWFGLHHLYLNRDRHAFTSLITFGLYFGIGWFRELWRIPEYVRDANEEEEYMIELNKQMRSPGQSSPPVSWARSCGSIIVADVLGYLVIAAIPDQIDDILPGYYIKPLIAALLCPAACAIGVHLIGNIGRHTGGMRYPLIAAYLTAPAYIFLNINSVFWSSIAANYAFGAYERRWRKRYDNKWSIFKRMFVLLLCLCLYASLWGSWFVFNCKIETQNGTAPPETIKCTEAAKNFVNSPLWKDFAVVVKDLYTYVTHYGIAGVWQEFIQSLDPSGEANALSVLMLNSSATQEEITNQYRRMIRVWHPDRHHDPVMREQANEKFIMIQQAYETLSNIKSRRMQNSRHTNAPDFEREKSEL
jgi:DnaJ family protein C protein 22